jgi:tRNA threonylcarbamoyladenosine biosynthesis protein TsaE
MIINSEKELKIFATNFATKNCSDNTTIALVGDLGAGKTTFVRYFVESLIPEAEVSSPTFPILATYQNTKYHISHYDLYRIKSQDELEELGLIHAIKNGITLIEWPEIAYKYLPKHFMVIKIRTLESNKREITIERY